MRGTPPFRRRSSTSRQERATRTSCPQPNTRDPRGNARTQSHVSNRSSIPQARLGRFRGVALSPSTIAQRTARRISTPQGVLLLVVTGGAAMPRMGSVDDLVVLPLDPHDSSLTCRMPLMASGTVIIRTFMVSSPIGRCSARSAVSGIAVSPPAYIGTPPPGVDQLLVASVLIAKGGNCRPAPVRRTHGRESSATCSGSPGPSIVRRSGCSSPAHRRLSEQRLATR